MSVVITGGAGFLGRKLARTLLERGSVPTSDGGPVPLDSLILVDLQFSNADLGDDSRVKLVEMDIRNPDAFQRVITAETTSVFHLAAVVSGEAESNFDLGIDVNLHGTGYLLEACRAARSVPTVVYTSSLAVYGGENTVDDRTPITPQNSYGAQKAMGEYLLNDYSRKGFVDGRGLRLPTVFVRPGKPNKAASSFASSIVREPLSGRDVVCPVTRDVRMPLTSPRRVIEALVHAHEMPVSDLGNWRTLLLCGLSPSVGEIVDSLERVAGREVTGRIRWAPDPFIQQIVDGWPKRLLAERAADLGFRCDDSVEEIITQFVDDELGDVVP